MKMRKQETTNRVLLSGKVMYEFQFSHTINGSCYYITQVEVKRTSGYTDHIPVMASGNIHMLPKSGSYIYVKGQLHSYNKNINGKCQVLLSVLAWELEVWDIKDKTIDENQIYLDGYICRQPIYRKTPLGRFISDVCIAVNLPNNHSDYIPCIFGNKNAEKASNLSVGCPIQIWGRIQSRKYLKKSPKKSEERTAYEVSVFKMIELLPEK